MILRAKLLLLRFPLVSVACLSLIPETGCRQAAAPQVDDHGPAERVTFNRDIAPTVFENCAVCHRPGEAGPFSLLSYQDVKKRDEQIVMVTETRYMPPWLPEPGYGDFVGERGLTDEQIRLIRQWVEEGSVEGAPSDLPPRPEFAGSWPLGEPDLVLEMPESYTLRAEGLDDYRNFVIPVPVTSPSYVRGIDIRPGNKKIVHHTNVIVDRTGVARRLDARDPGLGFGGMDLVFESDRFEPHSHFLFWKPGTPPAFGDEDMAWRVDRATDLVLNMHLYPSGKPEPIRASIGLYFTDQSPTRHPMLLQLEHDGALDIPAGEKNFIVIDDFELPLDVEVLGVYPHAHYLGKDIQGFATLPDGTKEWLIWIKDWDFNWQAVYRYRNPISLPGGTTLSMRFTYDNSAENPRNPTHPPRRVVGGNLSTDEMSHLWIQVLPREGADARMVLQESLMRHRLRKYPEEFSAHFNLGAVLQTRGKLAEAIHHFRQALRIKPDDPTALNNLGTALREMGRLQEATGRYRDALRVNPDYVNARYNLAQALLSKGDTDAAVRQLRQILRTEPDDVDTRYTLGYVLAKQGRPSEAVAHYEHALRIEPDDADTHNTLGFLYAVQGKLAQAVAHYQRTIRLEPDHVDAHNDLGSVLARQGRLAEAVICFEKALRLDGEHALARENLERTRAQLEKDN